MAVAFENGDGEDVYRAGIREVEGVPMSPGAPGAALRNPAWKNVVCIARHGLPARGGGVPGAVLRNIARLFAFMRRGDTRVMRSRSDPRELIGYSPSQYGVSFMVTPRGTETRREQVLYLRRLHRCLARRWPSTPFIVNVEHTSTGPAPGDRRWIFHIKLWR